MALENEDVIGTKKQIMMWNFFSSGYAEQKLSNRSDLIFKFIFRVEIGDELKSW